MTIAFDETVLHVESFAKYAHAFFRMPRSHLRACHLGSKSRQFHLLRADRLRAGPAELAFLLSLDPGGNRLP